MHTWECFSFFRPSLEAWQRSILKFSLCIIVQKSNENQYFLFIFGHEKILSRKKCVLSTNANFYIPAKKSPFGFFIFSQYLMLHDHPRKGICLFYKIKIILYHNSSNIILSINLSIEMHYQSPVRSYCTLNFFICAMP